MRPVNLIPPEQRRRDRGPARTGAAPMAVVGVLVLALGAIVTVTLTGNQLSEGQAERDRLEVEEAAATARVEALGPYAGFATLALARQATVTSLAQSRFDWERVLRELALVMPADVWLVSAEGSAGAGAGTEDATAGASGIAGPSLSLSGCGASHEAVAGFVAALEDIDGATRVGISSSERVEPSGEEGADATGAAAAASGAEGDCRTRDFIARFEIVVAFDDAVAAPAVPAPTAPPAPAGQPVAAEAEIADAGKQTQQARESAARQTERGRDAAGLVPGVAGVVR